MSDSYVSSQEIAQEFGCSIRAARRLVKLINIELEQQGFMVISKQKTLRHRVIAKLGLQPETKHEDN